MKITYENICCIRHAELDFKPGQLIAIVGETNQGKSALLYTLLSGFTNSTDFKKFINNDALKENSKSIAKISILDDKNNFWQVEAGKDHLYYRAGDTKYEKVGRKNIFELTEHQIPGLLYDPENTTPIMNIVDEDTGMFPIDRSDTQIFKTYERLLSLSCTEDILRTIKLDQEDIDFKVSTMTTSIQDSQEKISKIDEVFSDTNIKNLIEDIASLESTLQTYNSLVLLYDKTNKIAEYTSKALAISFEKHEFDVKRFEDILTLLVKANNYQKYIQSVQTFETKEAFDVDKAKELFNDLVKAQTLAKEVENLKMQMSKDNNEMQDIIKILDSIKVCPFCGKPMET